MWNLYFFDILVCKTDKHFALKKASKRFGAAETIDPIQHTPNTYRFTDSVIRFVSTQKQGPAGPIGVQV